MAQWNKDNFAEVVSRAVAAAVKEIEGKPGNAKGWHCNRSDCLYAVKGWENWAGRRRCQGCFYLKAEATNPPATKRLAKPAVTTAEPPKSKDEAKKEKRARVKKAKQDRKATRPGSDGPASPTPAAQPPPDGANKTASADDQPAESTNRLALSKEVAESLELDALIQKITTSLKAEVVPKDLEEKKPEEIMDKFLSYKGPTAKAQKRKETTDAIINLKQALISLEKGGVPLEPMAVKCKAEILENEALLAKLNKEAPTVDFENKAVAEAKAHFEVWMQTRKDREAKGAAVAKERVAQRTEFFTSLEEIVAKLKAEITNEVAANAKKHADRAKAMAEQDKKVIALFDAKLATLSPPAPPAPAVAPVLTGQSDQITSLAELTLVKKRLEEIAAENARLNAIVAKADGDVHSEFDRSFEIPALDIPIAEVPDKENISSYGTLYCALAAWSRTGSVSPFDWESLRIQTINAKGPSAPVVVKSLLGDLWKKWYPADPLPHHVVPRQVAQIAFGCLNGIKLKYESKTHEDQVMKEAESTYALMVESGKKLRKIA